VNIPSSNPPCSTPVKISTYEQFIPPCTPIRNVAQDTSDDEESTYSHGDRTCSSYKPSNLSQMEALEDDVMDISSFEEENVEEDIHQAVHGNKYVDAEKYIVFHDELLELFRCCPVCGGVASGSVVEKVGTMIKISWVCHVPECNFQRLWRSQPMIHHMPAGNLLVSASILLTGSLPTQALRMFQVINISVMSQITYFKHQRNYLFPVIIGAWKEHQEHLIAAVNAVYNGKVILSGDGRSDSPGHCAKYGTFTVIEQQINKVLDVQQVQVIIIFICLFNFLIYLS